MTNKQHNAVQQVALKYQTGQDVSARDIRELREVLGDKADKTFELFARFLAHESAWRALRRAALIAFTNAQYKIIPGRGVVTAGAAR